MATTPFTGSVTGSSTTPVCQPCGDFTISLSGTWTGTVYPEKSYDGTIWQRISADVYGAAVSWTGNGNWIATEPESTVFWRLNYAVASGTLVWRISAG